MFFQRYMCFSLVHMLLGAITNQVAHYFSSVVQLLSYPLQSVRLLHITYKLFVKPAMILLGIDTRNPLAYFPWLVQTIRVC